MKLLIERQNHLQRLAQEQEKVDNLRKDCKDCHDVKIRIINQEIKLREKKIQAIIADIDFNYQQLEKHQLVHQIQQV